MEFLLGICDDDAEQIHILRRYLHLYDWGEDSFAVIESNDPARFMQLIEQQRPHLVLLDVDMGAFSGIQLGELIRERYPETSIIFVTGHERYAFDAFQLRAFHYLLKPLTYDSFQKALQEVLAHIQRQTHRAPEPTFTMQIKGEWLSIPCRAILYFEKVGHRVKIHTAEREVFFYASLQELAQQLDAALFLQCHQGYIVNMDHIRSYRDKTLQLEGAHRLPVSRSRADEVRARLATRLFGGGVIL